MDQNRLRKLAGLNESREELKEETNASLIKDLENNGVRQMKLLETKLGKVLRAASVIGAELAVIKLGLDATTDALADGEIGSSREAIRFMVKHAKNSVDENEDFFIETFGDEFRFLVEGLVEGEKVKPKV